MLDDCDARGTVDLDGLTGGIGSRISGTIVGSSTLEPSSNAISAGLSRAIGISGKLVWSRETRQVQKVPAVNPAIKTRIRRNGVAEECRGWWVRS